MFIAPLGGIHIQQLYNSVRCDFDVGGLDVPVHNRRMAIVEVRENCAELSSNINYHILRKSSELCQSLLEGITRDI